MKKIKNIIHMLLFVSLVSNASPSLIEGNYEFYDATRTYSGWGGSYSGEIDIENQTGSLSSHEPFSGAYWTANIKSIYAYDEMLGGEQYFSWDVVKQIWFDTNNPYLIIECYREGDQCQALSPAAFLIHEEIIRHPFVLNKPGQFVIGTFVNWYTNEIPNLMTLESQSGSLDASATTFVSFDGDFDGAPGYAMVANPFPNQTFAFSGYIGSKDGIFVSDLMVAGGGVHECSSVEGANLSASVNVTVNNDSIATIEWLLNDNPVGMGASINLMTPLGTHQLKVIATATSGKTAIISMPVMVKDTTSPDITVEFVDTKTGAIVDTIDRNGLTRLIASYVATDICDPVPVVTATGGFNIVNQSFLPVKVLNNEIIMDIPEMRISAVAVDASGNTESSSAILTVK